MAERRMFAKSVIGSARFLRMPASSRLLYYDLGMQADDDGVVEAFAVMRTTGATEDDLRILTTKGFVSVLNEDLVTYITDWSRNNLIKKDRYHPSVYANLLVKVIDGTQTEPIWNPSGTQTEPEDRLGKDSIGEVSISTSSSDDDQRIDYQSVVDLYNFICLSRPKVKTLTDKRKTAIRKRLFEVGGDISELQKVFEAVEISDFLSGRSGKWDGCSFDWIMKSDNFVRIREGNYTNQNNHTKYDYSDVSRYVGTSMDV